MYQRRLLVCMLGGVIAAAVCLVGRQVFFGSPPITWDTVAGTMANRVLLGFVIAISGWRINHFAHGALIGLIVSLTASIGFLLSEPFRFLLYTTAGVVYGILIEWLSTDLFKAPIKAG